VFIALFLGVESATDVEGDRLFRKTLPMRIGIY